MSRYWGKLMRKQKIVRDLTAEAPRYQDDASFEAILEALCPALDVARPVVLSKHKRDLAAFGRVKFIPGDFIEAFPYDAFEVEYIP